MSYDTILIEKREQIGLITLNRPQKFNAFNAQLAEELKAALRQLDENDEIQVIILSAYPG